MSLLSQLIRTAEHIKETGTTTAVAIRELWPQLVFTNEEATQLQQEGFGAMVNALLTSARRMEVMKQSVTIPWPNHEAQPAEGKYVSVNLVIPKAEPKILSVTVRILEDTVYDIRGSERKAVADFEENDCGWVMERCDAAIAGQERHRAVFGYTQKALRANDAARVRELPDDEQYRIAHMLNQVKKGEDPFSGGPIGPPSEPVKKIGPKSQPPIDRKLGAA